MVLLSKVEEDVLQAILEHYIENDAYFLSTTYSIFPQYTSNNLFQYLDSLKSRSLIASYNKMTDILDVYLTPDGINYFNNKKKKIFPKNSMDLLHQLLDQDNPVEYMQHLFESLDFKSDSRLRAMMRDLREKGYIETSWADNVPYIIEFNEKAYTIDEECIAEMKNGTYIVNNITNGNANINSIDNSVRNVNMTNNEMELFEKMLKVASDIAENDKNDIIMAIEDMKKNYDKPSLKEKYFKFIEVAANHMALFTPFIPAITELLFKASVVMRLT